MSRNRREQSRRAYRNFVLTTLESMESRQLLSTFMVTTLSDSGVGSFRQAILDANENPGSDVIAFHNPGPTYPVFQPLTPLPNVTDPVLIDGTSEIGFIDRPIITLDGSKAGSAANGLSITGGQSTITGLVITGFSNYGVVLAENGGNLVKSNYIGVDVTGGTAVSNVSGGINIFGSSNNTIGAPTVNGGNVISGNGGDGVDILGARPTAPFMVAGGNQILSNYIGIDSTGKKAVGNRANGIFLVNASANAIGGSDSASGNVISGNGEAGIAITGDISGLQSSSSGGFNRLQGNKIGTSADGNVAIGNGGDGITVDASANSIGGTVAGAANIIAYNGGHGVAISGIHVPVLSNNIFANSGLGIDLKPGANLDQKSPTILSVVRDGDSVTVSGSLVGDPSTPYTLQFFGNNAGESQARVFVGSSIQTTDATGLVVFKIRIPTGVPVGGNVTVTATNASGDTSELSASAVQLPTVSDVILTPNRRQVVIVFSTPMDASRAMNPANYRITAPKLISIKAIVASTDGLSVTLTLKRAVPIGTFARVVIDSGGTPGLTDTSGVALDGDQNGQAGGTFTAQVAIGKTLAYTDATKHKVTLKLANSGSIEVYRSASGNAQIVRLFGVKPGKSVLSGTVKGKNVTTPIPLLAGLNGAVNKLKTPPFVIGKIV